MPRPTVVRDPHHLSASIDGREADRLDRLVPEGRRSSFIRRALAEALDRLEAEQARAREEVTA